MAVRLEELEGFIRAFADDTEQEIEFWKDAAQALVVRLDEYADAH